MIRALPSISNSTSLVAGNWFHLAPLHTIEPEPPEQAELNKPPLSLPHIIMSQTMLQTSTAGVSLTANTTINPREELLSNLKGQTAHIPNLKPIFADWKGIPSRHMSPFVAPLREKMNTRIRG